MKITSYCISCVFDRAKFESDLAFYNEEEKLKALKKVAELVCENLKPGVTPAFIGTKRSKIIAELSSKRDFYMEIKKRSNEIATELLGKVIQRYEEEKSEKERIKALLKISAIANSMEFGVKGHSFSFENFEKEFVRLYKSEVRGNISKAVQYIRKNDKILYILDNAGEVIFDKFIAEELRKMGKEVIISPKTKAIMNDVTVDDLKNLNFSDFKILPSNDNVGIDFESAEENFLEVLFDKHVLIISKGMGNYETLSEREKEFRGRLIYALRAKCLPVASSLNVEKGSIVVKAA